MHAAAGAARGQQQLAQLAPSQIQTEDAQHRGHVA